MTYLRTFLIGCVITAVGILLWARRSHEPPLQPDAKLRDYITRFPPCSDTEAVDRTMHGLALPVWEGRKCYIVPLSAGGMK